MRGVPINGASPFSSHDPGVSGGAFGGYTQSNVAARRVVPTKAAGLTGPMGWVYFMENMDDVEKSYGKILWKILDFKSFMENPMEKWMILG